MTDLHALIHRMADELDHNRQCLLDNRRVTHPLAAAARAAMSQPEPERLTVQKISNLPQHRENYIAEDWDDEIVLDGRFSRADLQQLADSIPKAYRLIMRGDGNGNTLPALQGLFTWTEGGNYGAEWRTLETQEFPFLDDSIPFGPIH